MDALLQVWPMLAALAGFSLALAGLMVGLFRWLRSDIRRLEGRMETEIGGVRGELRSEIREVRDSLGNEIREVRDSLKGAIASVREEVASVREEVVSLRVDVGFIKGKLDLLERYIMRRNDTAAAPAE